MQRRYTSDEAGSLHYMSSVKLQKQLSTFKHAPRDLIRCCIPSTVSARPSAIMRALGFRVTSIYCTYVCSTDMQHPCPATSTCRLRPSIRELSGSRTRHPLH